MNIRNIIGKKSLAPDSFTNTYATPERHCLYRLIKTLDIYMNFIERLSQAKVLRNVMPGGPAFLEFRMARILSEYDC